MLESKARVAEWGGPACSVCPRKPKKVGAWGLFLVVLRRKKVALVIKHTRTETYYHWNKPERAVLTSSLADLTHSSMPSQHGQMQEHTG